jgi:hypothetical protein
LDIVLDHSSLLFISFLLSPPSSLPLPLLEPSSCAILTLALVQVLGALIIFVWTVGMSAIMFLGIKYTVGIRVSNEVEDLGLDVSEHGALFEEDVKPTSGPTELWTAPMQLQPHALTHALPSTMGIA